MSVFGHNHVIASFDLTGAVNCGAEIENTSVELSFPVQSLVVDNRNLRDLEGDDFSSRVSEKNINGTRKNLLGNKVLDAENHSSIQVKSTAVVGDIDSLSVTADVTIAGKTNSISFPASATLSADVITVSGIARIRHKDLGLLPFSAAFGTLTVHPDLTVRFEIVAILAQSSRLPANTCHYSAQSISGF
jgi:polyisoprenoid-binding protein YceI